MRRIWNVFWAAELIVAVARLGVENLLEHWLGTSPPKYLWRSDIVLLVQRLFSFSCLLDALTADQAQVPFAAALPSSASSAS